jgi:hypothetical protein
MLPVNPQVQLRPVACLPHDVTAQGWAALTHKWRAHPRTNSRPGLEGQEG